MKKIHLIPITLSVITLWQCANMGAPQGGPKDVDPPVVLSSEPEANALDFSDKKIEIEFDELIKLEDALQKVVISPPVNKRPDIRAIGRKLVIEFDEDEELQPNTTYTIDFGDAIIDNNEGNKLPYYHFSFSTGQTVDSLQVSGHLFEADDYSPADGVFVFIHKNLSDTAFTNLVPIRLAKTNKEGFFVIPNLTSGN